MPEVVGSLGRSGGCPMCNARLPAQPHRICAELRCPRCSAELWVISARSGPRFLVRRRDVQIEDYVADLVAARVASKLERAAVVTLLREGHAPELNLDSVDYIEVFLEIEDALERAR